MPPTILEHMFETTPFAVAMSPVVRVADLPGPRNDSAAQLAMVGVLTPGPVAMDLLTQVQIHRLVDSWGQECVSTTRARHQSPRSS